MPTDQDRKHCVTCGLLLEGTYCHGCGEKLHEYHDFSLARYTREIVHQLTSLDAKIFKTIHLLLVKPGLLTKEYLLGRKSKYIRPVRLYLSFSMLYFFTFSFFDRAALLDIRNILRFDFSGSLATGLATKQQVSLLSGEAFYRLINQELNNKIALLLFLVIFAYALVFKLLFLQKKKYYVEHLVFCLHLMSFSFLRDVLILPLYLFNKPTAFLIAMVTTVIYLFLSMRRVYSAKAGKVAMATIGLYSVFGIMFVGCTIFALYQVLLL